MTPCRFPPVGETASGMPRWPMPHGAGSWAAGGASSPTPSACCPRPWSPPRACPIPPPAPTWSARWLPLTSRFTQSEGTAATAGTSSNTPRPGAPIGTSSGVPLPPGVHSPAPPLDRRAHPGMAGEPPPPGPRRRGRTPPLRSHDPPCDDQPHDSPPRSRIRPEPARHLEATRIGKSGIEQGTKRLWRCRRRGYGGDLLNGIRGTRRAAPTVRNGRRHVPRSSWFPPRPRPVGPPAAAVLHSAWGCG